ncbi:MAG: ectoine hydroxylase [Alphaproteobacteria bacterium]|nr:ectoine hydroxylase [Alphaproteobacteria bacterium]
MEDLYPSRRGEQPRFLPRKDAVVYRQWSPGAPISQRQTASYDRDGLLVLKDLFDAQEIDTLRREGFRLSRARDRLAAETAVLERGSGTLRSVFKIHEQSRIFGRLAADSRLVKVAQFLLGDDVYVHQSRLNYKPGFEGESFYWHSDFETWHVEDGMPRMRALSMSILLSDNVAANAPTMFMLGSHKRFVTCVGHTPENHYKVSLKKQEYGVPDQGSLTELAKKGIAVPTGKAGTVIVFDCNTMHGSNSNISPFPRSNAFIVFNAVANRLRAPFGPPVPRPEFTAARERVDPITPIETRLSQDAA